MPYLLALGGLLLSLTGSLVGRVLLSLGLGLVTYTGFQFAVDALLVQIKNNFAGLPIDILNFLAYMWVDRAIGLMFSTFAACLLVKLAGSTSLKKWVVTQPTI
jgi:hypothetical protein